MARARAIRVVSAQTGNVGDSGGDAERGAHGSSGKGTPTDPRRHNGPSRAAASMNLTDGVLYDSAYTLAGRGVRTGPGTPTSGRHAHITGRHIKRGTAGEPRPPAGHLGGAQRTARRPWREPATARRSLKVVPTSLIHSLSTGVSELTGRRTAPHRDPSRNADQVFR